MAHWTLDDIAWDRFDPAKLDPEMIRVAKAASLVESNGGAYATHLCHVFHDDPAFQALARQWGVEEVQHGQALARWAAMADPSFDFDAAFARFRAGYKVDFDSAVSRRGSRCGEMIARCIVEVGTSSYYAALGEASGEPVLKEVCRRIAADELRHYKLFYKTLNVYLEREGIGFWRRLRIALGRVAESEDDELAYAYYAANESSAPYERRRYNQAYVKRAYALYRPHHVERGIAMIFKAIGLTPNGRLGRMAGKGAWHFLQFRAARLARADI